TIPAIRQISGLTFYYIPYQFGSFIGPEKYWNEEKVSWITFLPHSQHILNLPILVLCMVYYHWNKAMLQREQLSLKVSLILWNASLALFSLAGTIRMGEETRFVLRTRPLLDSISYCVDTSQPAAFWACCFAVSKVVELCDTGFIILRKKRLIVLHWYHHAAVLVYVWHSFQRLVAGCRWFITMNYAVHSLMYTYYTLTAAGIRLPRALSIVITTLQTTQMPIGVVISFTVLFYRLQGRIMQQSNDNLLLCFAIYISFAVLFMNFFQNSYMKKRERNENS
ncbi:hypothetical protein PENTCL1PPCAC_3057, partial [Pristionchus entomophagus]